MLAGFTVSRLKARDNFVYARDKASGFMELLTP